jgi:hypothetical protein
MNVWLSKDKTKSLLVFLLLLFIACITVIWGKDLALKQNNIRVWDWLNVAVLFTGIPFILLQKEACLPEVLQSSITTKQRFFQPLLIGLFFGILDLIVIKLILHPQPYDSLPPFLQPFPYSIFLFTSGSFEIEIFYRLIPITIFLLLGRWIFNRKYSSIIFWTAAILTSVREVIEQWPSGATWFIAYATISGFMMNLFQAIYFRNAGFLASLSVRWGHYLVWHILLGIYVQYWELAA